MNSKVFDTIIEKGILFLIIFTPLAFGSVQEWASAVMEIAAFVILLAWIGKTWSSAEVEIRDGRLLLPAVVLISYIVFQLLPLPPELLKVLAPANANLHWEFGVPGDLSWKTISIHPWATRQELLQAIAYCSVFFVMINHYRDRAGIQRILRSVIFMGAVLVLIAIAQKATWNGRLLWFYPVEAHTESFRNTAIWGPFINRNHFAGYLEMVIPLALASSVYLATKLDEGRHLPLLRTFFNVGSSHRLPSVVSYGLLGLVLTATLFATLSRGGIVGVLSGLLVFFILVRSRGGLRKRADLYAIVGIMLLLMLVVAGWEGIERRLQRPTENQSLRRIEVWTDAGSIVRDFQLFGTGLGTFGDIYPKYQTHSSTVFYDHAHNDYVEVLTDLGYIGLLLCGALVSAYVVIIYRKWRERGSNYIKILGAGGIASLAAIGVHSITDFNLHIPANALLLTLIAGSTYASHSASTTEGSTGMPEGTLHIGGRRKVLSSLVVMIALLYLVLIALQSLLGSYHFGRVPNILDDRSSEEHITIRDLSAETLPDYQDAIEQLEHASRYDRDNARIRRSLADMYFKMGNWSQVSEQLGMSLPDATLSTKETMERAKFNFLKAIQAQPMDPDLHLGMGQLLAETGDTPEAAYDEYRKAVAAAPHNAGLRYSIAVRSLLAGKKKEAIEHASQLIMMSGASHDEDSDPEALQKARTYTLYGYEIIWRASNKDPDAVLRSASGSQAQRELALTFLDEKGIRRESSPSR